MSKEEAAELLSIEGREVRITHPDKLYFSRDVKLTKLEVVQYYLSVAEGAVRGVRDRPNMLKRFVNGAEAPPFYQKRAPDNKPEWLRTVTLSFPSGRAFCHPPPGRRGRTRSRGRCPCGRRPSAAGPCAACRRPG